MKVTKRLLGIILYAAPVLINAQISGTFTIGSGGDYASFSEVIDTLTSQGLSGPAEFNIISGSYQEHFTIPEISGASEVNTITFKSQAGIADSVVLWDSTTVDTNFVVKLDGADFIIFKNMTMEATGTEYSRVIFITGNSDNNKIIGNVLNGNRGNISDAAIIYSEASDCDSLMISENIFNNGGKGIYLKGGFNDRPNNTQIINNTFNKMTSGIRLDYNIAPKIIGNTIDAAYYVAPTVKTGIYLTSCEGALQIVRNRIHHYNSYGLTISGFNEKSSTWGLIANNFVYSSTKTADTWGMTIGNVHYLKIYHNTVVTHIGKYAFALSSGGYGGSHIEIVNNNFVHLGERIAYNMMLYPAVDRSDNNNIYTAGHNIANWHHTYIGGTPCPDLDSLQSRSGMDLHSLDIYPVFPNPSEPYNEHPWLDGAATPLEEVTDDIDGNPRDPNNPDIGCCEFTSNPASTPYAGSLTIGSGGDFAGFSEAMDSLTWRGISGAVQLDVLPGTYNEQLRIRSFPGASWQDTIVFQSQSGKPEDVTLHYTPSEDEEGYVVKFYGSDHITFKGMTIFADTAAGSNKYYIFKAFGETKNLKILSNILSGPPSTNTAIPLIQMTESSGSGRAISGNTFLLKNYNGIEIKDSAQSEISILGNTFHGGNNLISIQNTAAPLIKGNLISGANPGSNRGAISLYDCSGPLRIMENQVYLSNGTCLLIRGCTASSVESGRIVNNFLRAGSGGGYNYGIDLDNSGYHDVYFNSISITSTNISYGRAIYIRGADSRNLSIVNNILCNTGGGYTYYVINSSSIALSDNNDIYTTGENLAHWDGNPVPDLDSLRTLSGLDLNSVSADPGFISASNLHANASGIDSMAMPIETVLSDIDGEVRNATHPDIGADEFTPGFNYEPVITSIPDTLAYTDSLYQYLVIASDHNADTLTYYLQSAPSWMHIDDSTGLVSGIPLYKNAGDTVVTILVADGQGGTDSQTYSLQVIPTTDVEEEKLIPQSYALYQNYPNPFNPKTTICYQLAAASEVELSIYNILGQKVATLVSEKQPAGSYKVEWDASGFASGVYLYRLLTDKGFVNARKLLLFK